MNRKIDIILKNNSNTEKNAKKQLLSLLKKYDLSKYILTDKVIIEDRVIPHSHPVLTLNTRHNLNLDRFLSVFIHENLHWIETIERSKFNLALYDLKKEFKYPENCSTKEISFFRHLIICYLELKADIDILGKTKAYNLAKTADIYRDIWVIILRNEKIIETVLKKNRII